MGKEKDLACLLKSLYDNRFQLQAMKSSRFAIGLILCVFALCISAQSVDKGRPCGLHRARTLWVVDSVALNDSVFDYTLDQMQSDSAAVLASRVLSWIYPGDIESISVIDSIEASEYGFVNCNGVVKIATKFREQLIIVLNGCPYKSKVKVSAGDMLGGYDNIKRIVKDEFVGLDDYGIIDFKIIKDVMIGCHPQRRPWVVVKTELPYYQREGIVGDYSGKRGKQAYELMLKADSTYVLSKNDTHKKNVVPEIRNYGTWSISKSSIVLNPAKDPGTFLQDQTVSPDTIHLNVNSYKSLTLPKGVWYNKKSVTLKRQLTDK